MSEQPTTKIDSTRPSDSPTPSNSPANSPAPSSTMSDPVHHEFGDQTEEAAGEGHKGPHTDVTKATSESSSFESL